MENILGSGTYGRVLAVCDNEEVCVKEFSKETRHMMYRSAFLTGHLLKLAADKDFLWEHFALAKDVNLIEDKALLYMIRYDTDLYSKVIKDGIICGSKFDVLMKNLCDAVNWLNVCAKIASCDISPKNVLYCRKKKCWVLADFDLWKPIEDVFEYSNDLLYIMPMRAPELLLGFENIDLYETETYAVGMVLDFANRGSVLYHCGGSTVLNEKNNTIRKIANHNWERLPETMKTAINQLDINPKFTRTIKKTRDWDKYSMFMHPDPYERKKMESIDVPVCADFPRITILNMDCVNLDIRQIHVKRMNKAMRENDCKLPSIAMAISILDRGLSNKEMPKVICDSGILPMASIHLTKNLIDGHNNGDFDGAIVDISRLYINEGCYLGDDIIEAINETTFMLSAACEWAFPLGLRTRLMDVDDGVIKYMIEDPIGFYEKIDMSEENERGEQ